MKDVPVRPPPSSRCQPVSLSHQTHSSYLDAPVTEFQLSATAFDPDNAPVSAGVSGFSDAGVCANVLLSDRMAEKMSAASAANSRRDFCSFLAKTDLLGFHGRRNAILCHGHQT